MECDSLMPCLQKRDSVPYLTPPPLKEERKKERKKEKKKKSFVLSKTSHSSLTENSEIQEQKILPDP